MESLPIVFVVSTLSLLASGSLLPLKEREVERFTKDRDSADGRLPLQLIPYHYDIDIAPDFYQPAPPFPFDGTVSISFQCIETTNVLTVNSVGLTITDVTIVVSSDSDTVPAPPTVDFWTLEASAQFLHVYVLNAFEPGARYTATITYNGVANSYTYGQGLYWDTYVSAEDQSTKYMLATQLEAIGAREMFPSFDEPDLKATFNVTVAYQPSMVSLSNMPVLSTSPRPNGWVASVYDKSPTMSTYQVCICIGDFRYIEADWQGIVNYPVRVYARPDIIDQMAYMASVAVDIQTWLEAETGIPYLMPKMDHIALPNKGGAMENWGLITYGESTIAINPETSSASGVQFAGMITAHELAHQWFGNLVTAEWWTDIWLNEGLTSYYDFRPTQSLGWQGTDPSQRDYLSFMVADQKNTSDPVRKQINTVFEADYSFGGSTYPKGSAMTLFLNGLLGQSTLNTGLTRYLNTYSYSRASSDNLYQSLTDQAADDGYPLDVKTIMDPWLNQMGFPLVSVVRSTDGTATVTQNHFLSPPNQEMNAESQWNYKWTIPMTIVTASSLAADWDGRPTDWLDIDATELVLADLPTNLNDWVIINPNQRFFYRVKYDSNNHLALVAQLVADYTKIPSQSRCQFIDDSFALARASEIQEADAMETTRYLDNEFSYNPWYSALSYTSLSQRMLNGVGWEDSFTTYMLSKITPVYTALGWSYPSEETPDEQIFRRDIISAACDYGLEECLQQARIDYLEYSSQPSVNSVNPNNLPTVLCTGVAEGTTEDWILVYDQYILRKLSQIREERYAYLIGISCTLNDFLLDRMLYDIVSGEEIASRDQYRATLYLSQNPLGAEKLWNYFDNSWLTVPSGMSKFTILRRMTEALATQDGLDRLNALIAKYPPESESQWSLFNQMTLAVQQNINWLTSNNDSLRDWLTENNPSSRPSTRLPRPHLPVSSLDHWHSMTFQERTRY